jgi:hypothetical protein
VDLLVFGNVRGGAVGGEQGLDEGVVLVAREGAVQVVGAAVERLVVAGGGEGDVAVHGGSVDDRADRVVEIEALAAGAPGDVGGERARGQRSGGDDDDSVVRDRADFFAADFDQRFGFE